MKNLTFDQIRGPLERLLYIGLAFLVARGYISSSQVGDIVTLGIAAIAVIYGFWQNSPRQIARSAAALPDTTVITSPDVAKSTPETNIVSADTHDVKIMEKRARKS